MRRVSGMWVGFCSGYVTRIWRSLIRPLSDMFGLSFKSTVAWCSPASGVRVGKCDKPTAEVDPFIVQELRDQCAPGRLIVIVFLCCFGMMPRRPGSLPGIGWVDPALLLHEYRKGVLFASEKSPLLRADEAHANSISGVFSLLLSSCRQRSSWMCTMNLLGNHQMLNTTLGQRVRFSQPFFGPVDYC